MQGRLLNRLFERITAMVEAGRRFAADAAPGLRTPIAAIHAQAQVALAETDDDARAHALRAMLDGCDRATRLVEQMLTLPRLEAGAAPALAAVDLSALAHRVATELAPRALHRHRTLSLDAEAPQPVHGDETLLAVQPGSSPGKQGPQDLACPGSAPAGGRRRRRFGGCLI